MIIILVLKGSYVNIDIIYDIFLIILVLLNFIYVRQLESYSNIMIFHLMVLKSSIV